MIAIAEKTKVTEATTEIATTIEETEVTGEITTIIEETGETTTTEVTEETMTTTEETEETGEITTATTTDKTEETGEIMTTTPTDKTEETGGTGAIEQTTVMTNNMIETEITAQIFFAKLYYRVIADITLIHLRNIQFIFPLCIL